MHPVEFFKFWVNDPGAKRPRLTAWKMTREEAAKSHPGARPEEWTREVRMCPETPSELAKTQTCGGFPDVHA